MDFSEYLVSKKINEAPFREGDPDLYQEFRQLFAAMHPKSFTMQKLFLINGIRRRYPLPVQAATDVKKAPSGRPKMPVRKPAREGGVADQKPSGNRAKTSTGKPLFKPRPLKPKISGSDAKGNDAAGAKKPARPVMKPKMPTPKTGEGEGGGSQEKPVKRNRPVMKPKIPAKPSEDAPEKKAIRPKPLMKPRIPGKKKESGEENTSPKAQEEKQESKKKSKPIIKPRKKND